MRCRVRRVLEASLLPLAMLGTSAVSAQQCPCTHFGVSANPPSFAIPRKILLFPLDVSVYRVGAGGVTERAEDLAKEEAAAVEEELRGAIGTEKKFEFIALPPLGVEAQARLDEHVALFEQVASAALRHSQGSAAWPQKVARFDYGVGDGLRFLKQATGADAALFVGGRASIPTTSSYVLGALTIFAGVITVPNARATAVAGVIDLDTGNVVWLNQSSGRDSSLPNAVRLALKAYPDVPAPADRK
jgi:hypothetical protein